jgi:hypothetical protein
MKKEIVSIQHQAREFIGKNWVGNVYRKKWVAYVQVPKSMSYMRHKGIDIPVKEVVFKSKTEMKRWLQKVGYKQ